MGNLWGRVARQLRRRLALVAALALPIMLVAPTYASAAGGPGGPYHQASLYAQQHHAQIAGAVAWMLGWAASHATAFLTHENASPRVKGAVVSVLSVVAGVVATVGWSTGTPWYVWVQNIVHALVASQAAYLMKDVPVLGSGWLQNRGPSWGDPANSDPTDPAVFPGAADGSG